MAYTRLTKEQKESYRDKIYEFLKKDKKVLEAFTGYDYYLMGSDNIWRSACSKLDRLSNTDLVAICKNIDNESKFKSYLAIFNV